MHLMQLSKENNQTKGAQKMKKTLSLILALIMLAACLGGCGAKPETVAPAAPAEEAPAAEAPTEEGVKQPDGYPSGTVTWIAPVAAGAAVDLPTRALADMLTFGTVVVENIAGASQTLGTAEAAARAADGYTLLTMANACGISQPIMNPELAYKLDDFRFLTMLTPTVQATICVKKGGDIATIEDLIKYIQENEYSYAIPNAGGYADICAATALDQLGAWDNANRMIYDGSNGAIQAVLTDECLFSCTDSTDAVKHLDELEVLAIFDSEPCSILPGIPVLSDYGVNDLHVITGLKWVAIRKDVPDDIAEFLKAALNEAIASDEYQQYLKDMGFLAPDDTFEVVSEEEMTQIVTEAGVVYKAIMEKAGMI